MTSRAPSLRLERSLQRQGHRLLAGMDEVGRGALAGPVTVGVVVIDDTCRSAPTGVRDSKLLTPQARAHLVPRLRRWARAHAVGHASPGEIDDIGIIAALRLAATRALAQLPEPPDLVVLDGNHDWLTAPERVGLLAFADDADDADSNEHSEPGASVAGAVIRTPPVTTMIKADLRCSSVAAASVLAKVERDAIMVALGGEHPAYGWEVNKGYAAPEHREALRRWGPCVHHRVSWRLLGGELDGAPGPEQDAAAVRLPGVVERDDRTGDAEWGRDGQGVE